MYTQSCQIQTYGSSGMWPPKKREVPNALLRYTDWAVLSCSTFIVDGCHVIDHHSTMKKQWHNRRPRTYRAGRGQYTKRWQKTKIHHHGQAGFDRISYIQILAFVQQKTDLSSVIQRVDIRPKRYFFTMYVQKRVKT